MNLIISQKLQLYLMDLLTKGNFYISREEVIIFFRDYGKMVLDAAYKLKQNET